MRLCRYERDGNPRIGVYEGDRVGDLALLGRELGVDLPGLSDDLLDCLPPDGPLVEAVHRIGERLTERRPRCESLFSPLESVKLLVPLPRPNKVLLLAGNYAEHVREGGGRAAERHQTFPYFFSKPPSTTLNDPGAPVCLPASSPDHIDWEIELGVILGRRCRQVSEAEALDHVAGYTVCNDISDRKFQINPNRTQRERDRFFDWLHGKWHDTFLPLGPCVRLAEKNLDPQNWKLRLTLNGQVMQEGSTSQMVFPVAALISILSTFVTLEPGDILSTGTPAGVGFARKPPVFLRSGDLLEASIEGIGVLTSPVLDETTYRAMAPQRGAGRKV